MFRESILGQETAKKHIETALNSGKTPHAQLFLDANGYGGLPMALFQSLLLLYTQSELETKKAAGKSGLQLLEHPDMHFVFPVINTAGSSKKTLCDDVIRDWSGFLNSNVYGHYADWFQLLNAGNKQGIIAVHEVKALNQKMYLKSFSGKNKVCLIWGAEKMNDAAANKFLKLLEEPPKNTFFILVATDTSEILPTIVSRCQTLALRPVADADLKTGINESLPEAESLFAIAQAEGSVQALFNHLEKSHASDFEAIMIHCLRCAFRAKGNKSVVLELMEWADRLALLNREEQKAFLRYGVAFLRNAFLLHYGLSPLVHFQSKNGFDLQKLAPFVHHGNFEDLVLLFENGSHQIERNGNAKMIFTHVALQTTRFLNKKP